MLILPQLFIGDTGEYIANAVAFDSSTYLDRDAAMTGLTDGNTFTVSFWVKRSGLSTHTIFGSEDGNDFSVAIDPDAGATPNRMQGVFRNSSGVTLLRFTSSLIFNISTWYHVLMSFDLSDTGKRHIYVNNAVDSPSYATYIDDNIQWSDSDFRVGRGNTANLTGDMADFWFDNSYIDLSIEAKRRKFISADGKPVRMGSAGKNPTGASPIIFNSGATDNWHINKATGGGFTENGTLTTATTTPSD